MRTRFFKFPGFRYRLLYNFSNCKFECLANDRAERFNESGRLKSYFFLHFCYFYSFLVCHNESCFTTGDDYSDCTTKTTTTTTKRKQTNICILLHGVEELGNCLCTGATPNPYTLLTGSTAVIISTASSRGMLND